MLKNHKITYGIIVCLILIVSAIIFVYIRDLKSDALLTSQKLGKTDALLAQIIEQLIFDNGRIATLEEQSYNLATAQEKIKSDASAKLSILSQALFYTQSSLDLSTIIKSWRPYIARISCTIETADAIAETSGSALLSKNSKYPYAHLVTNRHIVMYDNTGPQKCNITFPDLADTINITNSAISYPSKGDIGIIDISKKVNAIDLRAQNAVNREICSDVSVGEKVVILGYPGIGSKSDITATEGIISGFDGDYFITSAKIEQGNSGGAAVLIRGAETCYLGIPTFVNVGKIEALARILSAKVMQ
jgi:S1-C subfamily serine protease